MRKVFVLAPGENWIVDRFVAEWNQDNADISVLNPHEADVVWLLADWCYRKIDPNILVTKHVITTIHHLVPEKFKHFELTEFNDRDRFTDIYHVPNAHTAAHVKQLTNKPIAVFPFWANQKIWKQTGNKQELREKYGLPASAFLVGSFQRDTEGKDLVSPKLEKGPDILADALEVWKKNRDLHVVLGGWRRQYIISRLKLAGIPFTYFEMPDQTILNELYQTLDLYPVTARYEGGPQSFVECGLLNIPMVSRSVGIAEQVLPSASINDDVTLATPAIPDVQDLILLKGYEKYRKLIQQMTTENL